MKPLEELQKLAIELAVPTSKDGKDLNEAELATAINIAKTSAKKPPAKKPAKSQEQLQEEAAIEKEKAAIAKVKKTVKKGEKTIKVLKPLSGRYLLSHTVGEIINIEAKQGDLICEEGYGKLV